MSDFDPTKLRLGGSDAGAILGVSKYETALDLYLRLRGLAEPGESGEAAYWGTRLEALLLAEYAQRRAVNVLGRENGRLVVWSPSGARKRVPQVLRKWGEAIQHARYPWMIGHVDGHALHAAEPERGIEVKTTSAYLRREWGEESTDQIPDSYLAQIAWYQAIHRSHGRSMPFDVPVLIGGQHWRIYEILPDDALMDVVEQMAAAFVDRVLHGDPPPATADERGRKALQRLYPHDSGREMDATPELAALAVELASARLRLANSASAELEIEHRIKEAMKDATFLRGNGFHISWKRNADSTVTDWQAACIEMQNLLQLRSELGTQEIIKRNTETKPGARVFRCASVDKLLPTGD